VHAEEALLSLLTALGIGLLIGVVRERAHGRYVAKAGIRTHALIAIFSSVTVNFGMTTFIAGLIVVGAFALAGYLKTADQDPGLTGEVAMIVTYALGGLAREQASLAAGLGVLVAILLYAKKPLQRLTREVIGEKELEDALILAASALVILPLLPQAPIDPWGVLDLYMIWQIVVLVMSVGMLGYIAQRALGVNVGLPIAGFFSGFVSSTLAVANFGKNVRQTPKLSFAASSAALLANLASLLLLIAVIGLISKDLFLLTLDVLSMAALTLLSAAGICFYKGGRQHVELDLPKTRAFKLTYAVSIALMIGSIVLLCAWLRDVMGDAGVMVTVILVSVVELHASVASLAQLQQTGDIDLSLARWGVMMALAASSFAKTVLAFVTGGVRYGLIVGTGLISMVLVIAMIGLLTI
jgi:uncharacterized membrane protein (DUF4010 family)